MDDVNVGRALADAPPSPINLVQDDYGDITVAGIPDSEVIDAGVADDLDILFVLLSGYGSTQATCTAHCLHRSEP